MLFNITIFNFIMFCQTAINIYINNESLTKQIKIEDSNIKKQLKTYINYFFIIIFYIVIVWAKIQNSI